MRNFSETTHAFCVGRSINGCHRSASVLEIQCWLKYVPPTPLFVHSPLKHFNIPSSFVRGLLLAMDFTSPQPRNTFLPPLLEQISVQPILRITMMGPNDSEYDPLESQGAWDHESPDEKHHTHEDSPHRRDPSLLYRHQYHTRSTSMGKTSATSQYSSSSSNNAIYLRDLPLQVYLSRYPRPLYGSTLVRSFFLQS